MFPFINQLIPKQGDNANHMQRASTLEEPVRNWPIGRVISSIATTPELTPHNKLEINLFRRNRKPSSEQATMDKYLLLFRRA